MAKIGEIGVETQNNGIVKVPIFDEGDSGSSVYEMVKVHTAGGTGFIPMGDPSQADYPFLKVNTNNHGILGAHSKSTFVQWVDNFNDGNMTEYTIQDSSNFSFTLDSEQGDLALQVFNSSTTGQDEYIVSNSGLDNYPSVGNTIRYYIKFVESDIRANFHFGNQTPESSFSGAYDFNGWEMRIDADSTEPLVLIAPDGDEIDEFITDNFSGFNEVEISWTSSSVDVVVRNGNGTQLGTVSLSNDSSITSGGIGYSVGTESGNTHKYIIDSVEIL